MTNLENQNILTLVFHSISLFTIKQLSNKINNRTINTIITRNLNYKNIFKSLGKTKSILGEHKQEICSLALLPNGNLLSISWCYDLKIWDMNSLVCLRTIDDIDFGEGVIVLPNGKLVSLLWGEIKIWDFEDDMDIDCFQVLAFDYPVYNISLLSDGNLICFSCHEEPPRLPIGLKIFDCSNDFNCISDIYFNHRVYVFVNLDQNTFALGHYDIKIFALNDAKNLTHLATLEVNSERYQLITSLMFNDKEKLLISGFKSGIIKVWDITNDYHCRRIINVDEGEVSNLLLLPCGYFAYHIYSEGIIKICDFNNYECVNTIEGGKGQSVALLFLKDYRLVITSTCGRKIILLD
jgi:WD40 repeat protein